jgi:hypothetical protein
MARKTTLASQLLAVTVAILLATAVPAAAGTGPTLGGPTAGTFEIVDTATINTTAICHPTGTSAVSFTASGEATGPFPGTFNAHGAYLIGPQTQVGGSASNNLNVGPLRFFTESFTIASADGTISGIIANLATPTPGWGTTGGPINTGTCTPFSNTTLSQVTNATGMLAEAQAYSRYYAKIRTPSGTFDDTGNSFTLVDQQRVISSSIGPFTAGEFFEDFFNGSSHSVYGSRNRP